MGPFGHLLWGLVGISHCTRLFCSNPFGCGVACVIFSNFQFLQLDHKMLLIEVTWYVLRVKNMRSGPPSDPLGLWGKSKLSYAYDDVRQGKVKLQLLKLTNHFITSPTNKEFIGWNQMNLLCYCDVRVTNLSWFSKF